MKVIEQIEGLQKQLEDLKSRHTTLYCNYVMQATVNDHKTEAMDALKGIMDLCYNASICSLTSEPFKRICRNIYKESQHVKYGYKDCSVYSYLLTEHM